MRNILTINQISLYVNLGLSEEERVIPQKIFINLKIENLAEFRACLTDKIDDTICYGNIIKEIRDYISGREFKLLEFLTRQIYELVKNMIKFESKLFLEIIKCNPPIEHIDSTSFICCDD